MVKNPLLAKLANEFSIGNLTSFLRASVGQFRPSVEDYSHYLEDKFDTISELQKIGEINYESERIIIIAAKSERELTSKTGRIKQYELAKEIIKKELYDAGIFVFYDEAGHFRFSLVVAHYAGTRRNYSNPRRYTFFVSPSLSNKTFLTQMGKANFSSIATLLAAFSIEAVSDDFYNEFSPKFVKIYQHIHGDADDNIKKDFALLFVIRIIFLGFVQKKGWLGNNEKFMQDFWKEYTKCKVSDAFYNEWLKPLFFEALNSPPGRKVKYQSNNFSKETEDILQMAPYLNGELFKEKQAIDTVGLSIPDETIGEFFEFLFQYNFTIEENTLLDEELELNPEFLGIIFERLVNKEDGAVYTPRTEVDFMCRMALLKWLEKNSNCSQHDLYHFFFREGGTGDEFDAVQKQGDFSPAEIRELIVLLESVTICDPAAGSGAFEVGMLHVLEELLENLYARNNTPADIKSQKPSQYDLKKRIIATSLYGVEVKRWAVWINQLRLWLTLFIDMPMDEKNSLAPLLPNLNFKVCCGDSLVQRIGNKIFPVRGHNSNLLPHIKGRITSLKKLKNDFFHNQTHDAESIRQQELLVFHAVIDAEIESLSSHAIGLSTEQQTLFEKATKQLPIELNKKDKERIEEEIKALREQKANLHKEGLPFIWNIEFAEIFFDKGGFDIIIGNPPYVQQEDIYDPYGKLEPKAYKEALQNTLELDFPNVLNPKNIKINGRSDLYTYFYVRSLHLLNPEGIHVFICSNSWLDVGYGAWLQEFLLTKVPIHMIVDNHAKRSFANADVNTIITVLKAPEKRKADPNHCIKFVAFKRPFEEVIITENLLEIERASRVTKSDEFRVYPITNNELWVEGAEFNLGDTEKLGFGKYIGDKWGGKYLRAPEVFFTILEKGREHINKFEQYFDGERYLNTGGADGFFIISDFAEVDNYYQIRNKDFSGQIERAYFRPLIKSVTKKNKYIDISNPDALCFVVENGSEISPNAQEYIRWGESQGYHKKSVTKTQNPWYRPTRQMLHGAGIILPRSFNDTFIIHRNSDTHLSLRFYRLHLKDGAPANIIAFLNSTLFWLFFETLGNKNLGKGVLDFFMDSFLKMKIPIILSNELDSAFTQMLNREIKTIFQECGINPENGIPIYEQVPNPLPDRALLDNVIFDAVGLEQEERLEVYRALCQLVFERKSKAQSA